MCPGREASLERGALCEIRREFRSLPSVSESTEADENCPDHQSQSMALTLKGTQPQPCTGASPTDTGFASRKFLGGGWTLYTNDGSTSQSNCGSNGVDVVSETLPLPPSNLTSANKEGRCSTNRKRSPATAGLVLNTSSKSSTPVLLSDEDESDDGVAVYIDEGEYDHTSDGPLITEYRVCSRKSKEIRMFKSKWIAQMLAKKDQLLRLSPAKKSARKSASNTETSGHASEVVSQSGSGIEFLESKLKAFAACMVPETLECINRYRTRWAQAPSDNSDSDTAQSTSSASRGDRRRRRAKNSTFLTSVGRQHPCSANLQHPPGALRRGQISHPKDCQLSLGLSASAALQSWGRFLKYIRETCKCLPPRPRVELKAGLQSDDDDEQAPLYMCRPGSVQRPSPLISYSLSEHLRAARTMFFKQFNRRCLVASYGHSSGSAVAEQPPAGESPGVGAASASVAAQAPPGSDSGVCTKVCQEEGAVGSTASETTDAVPLYDITAETSRKFGDMMRLEDTARMLNASCTFRLAAAPASVVRLRKWRPKTAAATRSCISAPGCPMGNVHSPSDTAVPAASAAPTKQKRSGYVTEHTNPHASTADASTQSVEDRRTGKRSRRYSVQGVSNSSSSCAGQLQRQMSLSEAEAKQGSKSDVVYTVHADEDTLALSGLDAEYCARVEFASREPNRAASFVTHIDPLQLNGSTLQETPTASAGPQKRRRKENVLLSDDEGLSVECTPVFEASRGAACSAEAAEELGHQRSLMADKLMLAHLMPYLPQCGP